MLLQRQSVCRSHGWAKSKCAGGRSRSSATLTTTCTRRKLKPPLVCACLLEFTVVLHTAPAPVQKTSQIRSGMRCLDSAGIPPLRKRSLKSHTKSAKINVPKVPCHSAVIVLTHCLHRGRSVQVCDVQGEYSVMRPQQRTAATKPGC